MAEIKTRPATPEFRDGWGRIFRGRQNDEKRVVIETDFRQPFVVIDDDEYHAKTYESAHA